MIMLLAPYPDALGHRRVWFWANFPQGLLFQVYPKRWRVGAGKGSFAKFAGQGFRVFAVRLPLEQLENFGGFQHQRNGEVCAESAA
jgi:hypothetical protein